MKFFCFCLSLRKTAYVIGVADCVLRLLGIGLAVFVIFFSKIEKNTFMNALYACQLFLMVIIVIACILLIVGAYKNIAACLLPWIIANLLYIILLLIYAGYAMAQQKCTLVAFFSLLGISVFYTYLVVSMFSFYWLIRQGQLE